MLTHKAVDTASAFAEAVGVLSGNDAGVLLDELIEISKVEPGHKRSINWPAKAKKARDKIIDYCKTASQIAATHMVGKTFSE